jgi:cyclic pyranopterin phosphate synthase
MTRNPPHIGTALVDRFGRRVSYVRISVTDRCDLRCVYCMSNNMQFLPRADLLTLEEIIRLGRNFVQLGVEKIRITGGEPLVRRDVIRVFDQLGALQEHGLRELTLTTNATQLPRFARRLVEAGVKRINISLDSLRPERFHRITRNGELDKVMRGIDSALEAGFKRVKLNSVILKHRNHDEVRDLVRFAFARGMDISFIEEMPLGAIDDHDRAEAYYSSDQVRRDLAEEFELVECEARTGGPSRYFEVVGYSNRVGFISPHSHNFCESCNRVRLTATGRLLLCLGQEHSMDLREVLRSNASDPEVRQAIIRAMDIKPRGHDFELGGIPVIKRHMNATGG